MSKDYTDAHVMMQMYIMETNCLLLEVHSVAFFSSCCIINFFKTCFIFDRPCGLVVRVPGYTTEMYCASCEVRTEFIYVLQKNVDRLCGLVARVPGYITEMYCVSCEVRTEFIYVM
jgi:hypothetical protein